MNKFLKITGIGGTTNSVIACTQIAKIRRDGGSPYNIVLVDYFDTDSGSDNVRLLTANTTEEVNVAISNFLSDKIVEALQLPYDKPMLEVPADAFPAPITSVSRS